MFSFTAHKKRTNIQTYIRRLCDLTTPNNAASLAIDRSENRANRAIPTLVCPWSNHRPVLEKCGVALTKDISDRGVGVIFSHLPAAKDVVLGFYLSTEIMSDPWFFLASRRRDCAIGGGFWLVGFELVEFMNDSWPIELEPLRSRAMQLLPPTEAPAEAACSMA
jgi:hypothetical protein